MAKVGFIGLGNMGGPMASNLVKAGHDVKVFDLSQAAMDSVVTLGASASDSANEAATSVDFVVTMLPAGKHVAQLYLGEQGLLSVVDDTTLLIDSSTIDATTARTVAEQAQTQGIAFIDAPVSGGVGGAHAGTLSFICGGQAAHFDSAKTILNDMGKNIFHAGDVGAGQVAKICNNMLLAVLMAGTSEALQMGIDNGLDPKVLSDIMLKSSGRNWCLELYNPVPNVMDNVPASNHYQGGFMVDLMIKDLGLAAQAAQLSKSSTPLGSAALSLYAMHSKHNNGEKDFSSIFELFNEK
ncbi:3-hydroxyisobutyrate dehydrogenase [Psychrobium sp. 1_MG-2023]|uniref:3-hydroxyisobutyrate dehydrogenase n=1 Tax=Psychrobium sp. 1_MG-2023 TaxID=3062624 RepID=UPI000C34F46B|nr:3-hydroxyisobutyrate dehydrogenase [Psychrobium sp. 1_MG-2023]MDP2561259.1 3-hydroxyisobutyrate dehydrogenase [Psychrobium sp. 1_MG-2023]PKF55240.1 3-hydroxyisobutyrate dehydrogenase [Alteromonadales bacterium alter-6D02]